MINNCFPLTANLSNKFIKGVLGKGLSGQIKALDKAVTCGFGSSRCSLPVYLMPVPTPALKVFVSIYGSQSILL